MGSALSKLGPFDHEFSFRASVKFGPSQPDVRRADPQMNLSVTPYIAGSSPTLTARPKPCFRFLDLPTELRFMVYEIVLVVGKVFFKPYTWDGATGQRYAGRVRYRLPELQLLRVCKQIHQEAEPVYLSKNLFVLPVSWQYEDPFRFLIDEESAALWPSKRGDLFSNAAYLHLSNVSVAYDATDNVSGMLNNEFRLGDEEFAELTPEVKVMCLHDEVHDFYFTDVWGQMASMLGNLKNLRYVEINLSKAYCPLGCRRFTTKDLFLDRFLPYIDSGHIIGMRDGDKLKLKGLVTHQSEGKKEKKYTYSQESMERVICLNTRPNNDEGPWAIWKEDKRVQDATRRLTPCNFYVDPMPPIAWEEWDDAGRPRRNAHELLDSGD